jgi:hypothetical protein
MTGTDRQADVAPEEEIDLEARLPSDEPGADLGEAYARARADDDAEDRIADASGPRVTDAYRSGS